jgi:hypothetical protein
MSVGPEKALKSLMAGLIYPAVLGSIIYQALDTAENQMLAMLNSKDYEFSSVMVLKLLLLCITLFFYGCDYLYLLYTRQFRKSFFFLDVVFVVGLYATARLIGLDDPKGHPNTFSILLIYLLFMVLYLIWDLLERRKCIDKKIACTEGEIDFYWRMVRWEVGSVVGLSAALALYAKLDPFLSTVLPLAIITAIFAKLSWEKKSYYSLADDSPEQEPASVADNVPRSVDEGFVRPSGEVVASYPGVVSSSPNPGPQPDVTAGAVPRG